jgi:hypothetical protein
MPRFQRLVLVIAVAATSPAAAGTIAHGQLADPVALNIGLICQWKEECMDDHKIAMHKALKFVAKYRPPQWRVEQCNRNAARGSARVDWIGFNRCIRNEALLYVAPSRIGSANRHSIGRRGKRAAK